MIVFTRTAEVAPGKVTSAIAFAHEIAGYLKTDHGREVEVLLPIGGKASRIAWASRYKDLAEFDAAMLKLLGDKKYMDQVTKAADNFLPGSVHDSIWRTI